jgi:hypothetical protein
MSTDEARVSHPVLGKSGQESTPNSEDINRVQSHVTYDFVYIDEESFEKYGPKSFKQLIDCFREYKP